MVGRIAARRPSSRTCWAPLLRCWPSRPPLRALADRAARHLRHVLRAGGVRRAAHRPGPGARGAGGESCRGVAGVDQPVGTLARVAAAKGRGVMLWPAAGEVVGLYFLIFFGLLTVLWDLGARRSAGVRGWVVGGVVKDGLFAFAQLVGPRRLGTASWTGWILTRGGSFHLGRDAAVRRARRPAARLVAVAVGLPPADVRVERLDQLAAPLPDESLVVDDPGPAHVLLRGAGEGCRRLHGRPVCQAITSIGTVSIWWGGTLAIFVLLFMWALRRDWQAGAVLCGIAAGYLPVPARRPDDLLLLRCRSCRGWCWPACMCWVCSSAVAKRRWCGVGSVWGDGGVRAPDDRALRSSST